MGKIKGYNRTADLDSVGYILFDNNDIHHFVSSFLRNIFVLKMLFLLSNIMHFVLITKDVVKTIVIYSFGRIYMLSWLKHRKILPKRSREETLSFPRNVWGSARTRGGVFLKPFVLSHCISCSRVGSGI